MSSQIWPSRRAAVSALAAAGVIDARPRSDVSLASRRSTTSKARVPPALLRQALERLLRPLVRLLIEQGVPFGELAELLKGVYVDVALRDFPLEGKQPTDSRVTLLTGVHRKDVRRLRGQPHTPQDPPHSVTLGALLVARWTGTPGFLDAEGHPRPLPRKALRRGKSFESLVESVSKDIRPRVVLDEWLRLGVVRLDAEDRVCLNAEAFVPSRGLDEKLFFFARNLHDHIAAAARNVGGRRPAFLERSVYYPGLARESVAELAKLAARVGMEALQAVNRRALELVHEDAGGETASQRMNFGLYFYDAPADDGAAPDEESAQK